MRTFSRWMPPADPRPATLAGDLLAGLVMVLAAPVMLVLLPFGIRHNRRLRRLAAERAGEGICTFARAFPRRSVDPWIIRAVHQGVQPWCAFRGGLLPVRADDPLDGLLGMVDEDVDDLVMEVATRAGRSLDGAERNPVRAVATVGDVVRFVSHQPRIA